MQDLLSFIFWKDAVDINKNLNTDTAALKGSRRKKYIPKSKEDRLFRFLMQ